MKLIKDITYTFWNLFSFEKFLILSDYKNIHASYRVEYIERIEHIKPSVSSYIIRIIRIKFKFEHQKSYEFLWN